MEEAVIRARFETYIAMPVRKIETMRPVPAVVDAIVAACRSERVAGRCRREERQAV
jgi:hypothetical protein